MEQSTSQMDLGIHLDEKLNLNAHVKEKISKANGGMYWHYQEATK